MERLRKDSPVLQELDEMKFENEQMRDAYNKMLLIYNGFYPDENNIISSINAASYLNCEDKLNELIILLHFSKNGDILLSYLNEDLLFHYNRIKYGNSFKETLIINDMLDLFKRFNDPLPGDFILACNFGSINIVKWISSSIEIDKDTNSEGYLSACKNNHFELIKWIFTYGEVDSDHKFEAFSYSIKNNQSKLILLLSIHMFVDEKNVDEILGDLSIKPEVVEWLRTFSGSI